MLRHVKKILGKNPCTNKHFYNTKINEERGKK